MRKILFIFFLVIISCAEQNNPKVLFENGNYEKAYKLWQPLAINGDLTAQNYIGIHYYLGLGVQRNYKLAEEWFDKAAHGGLPNAQYNLGVMYENGEFVEQNYVTASMWFYLSAEKGNEHAKRRMQGLLDEHKLFPNQFRRAQDMAEELF